MPITSTPEGLLAGALARAGGGRNNSGLWLACQLRDSGLDAEAARPVMIDYAGRVGLPQPEAMASLRSAYHRPPREPLFANSRDKKRRGAYMPRPAWLSTERDRVGLSLIIPSAHARLRDVRDDAGNSAKTVNSASRLREVLNGLQPYRDSTAQEYLKSRGIVDTLAECSDVKYHPNLYGSRRVVFALRDKESNLVAVDTRSINSSAKQSFGEKSLGVFSTPGALDSQGPVAICEAPIDALTLWQEGLPALALCGSSWPGWLPTALRFRKVYLATDADLTGDRAADTLSAVLESRGARVIRLRPPDSAKDWNEALCAFGRIELPATVLKSHQDALTARSGPLDVSEDLPESDAQEVAVFSKDKGGATCPCGGFACANCSSAFLKHTPDPGLTSITRQAGGRQ